MRTLSNPGLFLWLAIHLLLAQTAPEVVRQTLDSNRVHRLPVGIYSITTIAMPVPISGLEGAFISQDPTPNTRVLLSFQPGSRYFSVRALATNVSANLNVILGQEIYALEFIHSTQPVYLVEFVKPTPPRSQLLPKATAPASTTSLPIPHPPTNVAGASVVRTNLTFPRRLPAGTTIQPPPNLWPLRTDDHRAPAQRSAASLDHSATPTSLPTPAQVPPSPPPLEPTATEPLSEERNTPIIMHAPWPKDDAPTLPHPWPAHYLRRPAPPTFLRPRVDYSPSTTDYPVSISVGRDYPRSYSYHQREDWSSYRRPSSGISFGISISIGSCPSRSLNRSPFP